MAVKFKKDDAQRAGGGGRESGTGKVPAELSVGNMVEVAFLNEVSLQR